MLYLLLIARYCLNIKLPKYIYFQIAKAANIEFTMGWELVKNIKNRIIFESACQVGNKFLIEKTYKTKYITGKIMKSVCKTGQIWLIKFLKDASNFDIDPDAKNKCLKYSCLYGWKHIVEFLFKECRYYNTDLECAFEYACEGGNINLVNFFIDKGAKDYNAGLRGACYSGNMDLISMLMQIKPPDLCMVREGAAKADNLELLKKYTNLEDDHKYIFQASFVACKYGSLKCVTYLSDYISDIYKTYLFEIACVKGQLEIVQYLLTLKGYGVYNIGVYTKICINNHIEILKLLIRKGGYVPILSDLYSACGNSSCDIFMYLVSLFIDVDYNKLFSYNIRASVYNETIMDFILSKITKVTVKMFHMACFNGKHHVALKILKLIGTHHAESGLLIVSNKFFPKVVKALAPFCESSCKKFFINACKKGQKHIIELLKNQSKKTLNKGLKCAAKAGNRELIQTLTTLGADNFNKALKSAAKKINNKPILELLISLGATKLNKPLQICCSNKDTFAAEYLANKGANYRTTELNYVQNALNTEYGLILY